MRRKEKPGCEDRVFMKGGLKCLEIVYHNGGEFSNGCGERLHCPIRSAQMGNIRNLEISIWEKWTG